MNRLIVDKNISRFSKAFLKGLGFSLIETYDIADITDSTATHPDMQFTKIGDKTALVAAQAYDYYSEVLPDYSLISIGGIKSPYPNDCIVNFAFIGDKTLITKHQYSVLGDFLLQNPIFVNQGYVRCSVCVLNENAVITADMGIANTLEDIGVKAYCLPDDQIKLNGYNNGFWGGCSGSINRDSLYFNGNIEALSCYGELIEILEKEKIEPIYHKETSLYDNGSIILID